MQYRYTSPAGHPVPSAGRFGRDGTVAPVGRDAARCRGRDAPMDMLAGPRLADSPGRSGRFRAHAALDETSTILTVVEESAAGARRHVAAWQELAARAAAPNVFYEPWNLLTALDTVASHCRPRLLFIYTMDDRERRLIGFFPFEVVDRYKGVPVRCLRLIRHIHCFLCTPLVHVGFTERCLRAFAEWFAGSESGAVLEMEKISEALREGIERHLRRQSVKVLLLERQHRALFRPAADATTYLKRALRKKYRKEFRRKERRLAECGRLAYRELGPDDNAAPWIDAFLRLESQGWKGRNNTALASSDAERAYFQNTAAEAHRLGKLAFVGFFLDDRPIALSCKFNAGDGVFAFKIAFDENYRRYSPGVLLELRYVVSAHQERRTRWMDSCADPNHFMADRLWLDRRTLDTLAAAVGPWGITVLTVTSLLKESRDYLRRRNGASIGSRREQNA